MHNKPHTTATGRTTSGVPNPANQGDKRNTANTPKRAIAISKPIANAISLPVNHFTIALETVIPAIYTPQPKMAKPAEANFALAGKEVQKEFKKS